MAIVINTEPGVYPSVTDEMLFVVYEATKANDEVTYPDYRYVCDIYVGGVLVARQRSRPDPEFKRGVFDVSTVLRDYISSYGLKATYANPTETYTILLNYQVKFGEEYDGVLYTNLLEDEADRDAYPSYAKRPFTDSHVLDDVINDWASNVPDEITGYKEDKWHIIPYYSNVSGDTSITAQFSAGGVIVGTAVTFSTYDAKTILQPNFGFVKLAATLGLSQAAQDVIDTLEIDSNINNIVTIKYKCTKYPTVVLAWLNPYGGYESQSFGLVSKKTKEISRKEFSQLNYRLNASGLVSYHENGVFYGSKKGYAASTKTMLKCTSHLLSDEEYVWLADLFSSTDVYMYDSVLDKFHPVSITDSNYDQRTYLNSKLSPLEFTVQFSDNYNSQFL